LAALGCCIAGCSKPNPIWNLVGNSDTVGSTSDGGSGGNVTTTDVSTSSDGDPTMQSTTDGTTGVSSTTDASTGLGLGGSTGGSGSTGSLDCAGVPYGGHCWYYGQLLENCNDVCQSHGGYDEDGTRDFVGSGAPNDTRCSEVMAVAGSSAAVVTAVGSSGYGCHWFQDDNEVLWETPGPTTATAAASNVRRLCACQQ
jgi:hypothetical protein